MCAPPIRPAGQHAKEGRKADTTTNASHELRSNFCKFRASGTGNRRNRYFEKLRPRDTAHATDKSIAVCAQAEGFQARAGDLSSDHAERHLNPHGDPGRHHRPGPSPKSFFSTSFACNERLITP